ncbi:serine protease, partial [Gulbenkiania mobilis]|uniref:serine protease n=1 Tax=Gulbenkiania mobilis TaxID=397457 RepID=UPI0034D7A63B
MKAPRVADQAESSAGKVVAMGHPYGMLPLMMSEGLTTGRKETTQMPGNPIKGSEWVLFTAAINPGMSGGGVFNEQGKLVGLISWRADTMNSRDVQQ